MTCKDCIHYERCKLVADRQITYLFSGIEGAEENECFKDKSDFIELPRIKNVKPFVRGEWVKNKHCNGWHCSVCKKDNIYAYIEDYGEYYLQDYFCPHCGADMRSETE